MSEQKEIYHTTTEALAIAAEKGITITRPTLLLWIKKNKLGFQLGGYQSLWYIDKVKFIQFLQGQKGRINGST